MAICHHTGDKIIDPVYEKFKVLGGQRHLAKRSSCLFWGKCDVGASPYGYLGAD